MAMFDSKNMSNPSVKGLDAYVSDTGTASYGQEVIRTSSYAGVGG